MAYEANYCHNQSSGGGSGTGTPGTGSGTGEGSSTSQTPVDIKPILINSVNFKVMTEQNGGDVVGSGTLTEFNSYGARIYKISATLPVSDPPTFEDNLPRTYYANVGEINHSNGHKRGTDDGLSLFGLTIINRTPDNFLRIDYYGGSGNGVINTFFREGA